jgi:hypothetical protein
LNIEILQPHFQFLNTWSSVSYTWAWLFYLICKVIHFKDFLFFSFSESIFLYWIPHPSFWICHPNCLISYMSLNSLLHSSVYLKSFTMLETRFLNSLSRIIWFQYLWIQLLKKYELLEESSCLAFLYFFCLVVFCFYNRL